MRRASAIGAAAVRRRVADAIFGLRRRRELAIHRRFSSHTMLPSGHAADNLHLVGRWRDMPGDIVECGVWRGGMSAAMATVAPGHHHVLFDSFEGLPEAGEFDGPGAGDWQRGPSSFDNCAAEESFAREAMGLAGVSDYELVKGWFADTVPTWAREGRPIAVLRLDGDWYDSTMVCLEHLFPLVVEGGGVIIDDYFVWEGCTKAVHDYLSRTGAATPIRSLNSRVAYLVKRA